MDTMHEIPIPRPEDDKEPSEDAIGRGVKQSGIYQPPEVDAEEAEFEFIYTDDIDQIIEDIEPAPVYQPLEDKRFVRRVPLEALVDNPPRMSVEKAGLTAEAYELILNDCLNDDWCVLGLKLISYRDQPNETLAFLNHGAGLADAFQALSQSEVVVTELVQKFIAFTQELPTYVFEDTLSRYQPLVQAETIQRVLPYIEQTSVDQKIIQMQAQNDTDLLQERAWLMKRLEFDQSFIDKENQSKLARLIIQYGQTISSDRVSGFFEAIDLKWPEYQAIVEDGIGDTWCEIGLKVLPFGDIAEENMPLEVAKNRHRALGFVQINKYPDLVNQIAREFVQFSRKLPTDTFDWMLSRSRYAQTSPALQRAIDLVRRA